jgi:hypothetical protein
MAATITHIADRDREYATAPPPSHYQRGYRV